MRRLHRLCRGRPRRAVRGGAAGHLVPAARDLQRPARRWPPTPPRRPARRARRAHRAARASSKPSPAITAPAAATPSSSARWRSRASAWPKPRRCGRRTPGSRRVLGLADGRDQAGRRRAADRLDLVERAAHRLHLGRAANDGVRPGMPVHLADGPGRPGARSRRRQLARAAADRQRKHGPGAPRDRQRRRLRRRPLRRLAAAAADQPRHQPDQEGRRVRHFGRGRHVPPGHRGGDRRRDHPRRRDRATAQQSGGDRCRRGRADLAARGGRGAAARRRPSPKAPDD